MYQKWVFYKNFCKAIFYSLRAVYRELTSNPVLDGSREWAHLIFVKHTQLSLRWELKYRTYLVRRNLEMYALTTPIESFWKREWNVLYYRITSFHKLWLIYIDRPAFAVQNHFFWRETNLYTLFNVDSSKESHAGEYIKHYKRFLPNIYWGFISFWEAVKIWCFSLLFCGVSVYVLLVKRAGVLPQTLFFWVGVSMLLYWLLSGFVFFVKKYQYSRYTSVIQRFWRRSYILFWGIESCLLLVFFYLTINASQESSYMFDQGHFIKTHLFSWKLFLFKAILSVALIACKWKN